MNDLETKFLGSVIRGILMAVLGGWIASHGISSDQVSVFASGLAGFAILVWGIWTHRSTAIKHIQVLTKAVHAVPSLAGADVKDKIIADAKAGKF